MLLTSKLIFEYVVCLFSVTQKLYNFQPDQETYLIKFVEPCPKVEWAGKLKRDRKFLVNTDSDDEETLTVTVFNPGYAEKTFKKMTSDRLEHIRLFYRKYGEFQWSVARTEITDNGDTSTKEVDFAAQYAVENNYGYSSIKWKLGNAVPQGAYEIKVETQCNALGGPDDIDSFSSNVLSGVIDLTRPEQYGKPLPLRDTVLIGEEITIVFTETLQCEKPYTFDLRVIILDTNYTFDRDQLQVICEGRKISFQIDPTVGITDLEVVMGKTFSVELGQIGTSVSNVFDSNGNGRNLRSGNIKFEKTLANLNLDEASSSFQFTLHNLTCAGETVESLTVEVEEKILDLLGLPSIESDRIKIEEINCVDGKELNAIITILPSIGGRFLRHESPQDIGNAKSHSIGLFQQLRDQADVEYMSGGRKLGNVKNRIINNSCSYTVGNLKILPSTVDQRVLVTDPDLLDEEEELYRLASSLDGIWKREREEVKEVLMKKSDRQFMVDEISETIDYKSRTREEELLYEIRYSRTREEEMLNEIHHLQVEFSILALVCIIIVGGTLFYFKG